MKTIGKVVNLLLKNIVHVVTFNVVVLTILNIFVVRDIKGTKVRIGLIIFMVVLDYGKM